MQESATKPILLHDTNQKSKMKKTMFPVLQQTSTQEEMNNFHHHAVMEGWTDKENGSKMSEGEKMRRRIVTKEASFDQGPITPTSNSNLFNVAPRNGWPEADGQKYSTQLAGSCQLTASKAVKYF